MSSSKPKQQRGLGKGLGALLAPRPEPPQETSGLLMCPIDSIETTKQPRAYFNDEALAELADSIRESGVIQPLVVRKIGAPHEERYQLVAGERRLRASKLLGLKQVPVLLREMTDEEAWAVALIENIQRQDLNAIEEAEAYRHLVEEFGMSQEQVAARVGRARSTVANALRLLRLPDALRDHVVSGELSAGHARAVLSMRDSSLMEELADRILEDELSVRESEVLAKTIREEEEARARGEDPLPPPSDEPTTLSDIPNTPLRPQLNRIERQLIDALSAKVSLQLRADGAGTLTIKFADQDALQGIVEKILGANVVGGTAR